MIYMNKPNYIPVKNMKDFNYDVISYYNQYYASPYVTQQRRILRNYINNNQTIKQSNKNPFINNGDKKFYFLYTYAQNYMIIENQKLGTTDMYIYINKNWCHFKHLVNKQACSVIKELSLREIFVPVNPTNSI